MWILSGHIKQNERTKFQQKKDKTKYKQNGVLFFIFYVLFIFKRGGICFCVLVWLKLLFSMVFCCQLNEIKEFYKTDDMKLDD